ncbi:MAG TPA: TetR/AcrR family transcriptional regulator [Rhizomicrobium sp.]|nr:TetR/AcrR family transcriptional regulator [Rhizomicrobium sp.]
MSGTNSLETTRWRRRKEARPHEILDAALAVFAEKGFSAARMEDISRRAGVTKGTIYLYFDSKEALFKALVRESLAPTVQGVIEQVRAYKGPSRDLLVLVLTTVGTFIRTSDRVVLPKIVIAEAGNFPELVRFYREEIIDKGLGLLEEVIARGIARGEFRKMEPSHAARLCIAPILLAAVWRATFAHLDKKPYDYEGFITTHIDTLLRGISSGDKS